MTTEIAGLGLSIDSSDADRAASALDRMTDAGARTEDSAKRVRRSWQDTLERIANDADGTNRGIERLNGTQSRMLSTVERVASQIDRMADAMEREEQRSLAAARANEQLVSFLAKVHEQAARATAGVAQYGSATEMSVTAALASAGALSRLEKAYGLTATQAGAVASGTQSASQALQVVERQAAAAEEKVARFGSAHQMSARAALSNVAAMGQYQQTVTATTNRVGAFADSTQRASERLGSTEAAARRGSKGLKDVEEQAGRTGRSIFTLDGLVAKLAAGFGAWTIIDRADSWGQLSSRLQIATDGTAEFIEAQERLMDVSNRVYKDFGASTELFIRTNESLKELGYSSSETLDMVEALSYSLTVSAANAERSTSVIDAWSKSILLGKMSMGEFQTIVSYAPRLQQALANSLKVTNEQLMAMVGAGELTSAKLMGVSSEIQRMGREADAMPVTVRDALARMNNLFMEWIGTVNEGTGAIGVLTVAINLAADNIGVLVAVGGTLVALKAAAWLTAIATASMTAAKGMLAASSAATVLSRSIGLLGGPLGWLVTAIGAGVTAWELFGRKAPEAAAQHESAADRSGAAARRATRVVTQALRELVDEYRAVAKARNIALGLVDDPVDAAQKAYNSRSSNLAELAKEYAAQRELQQKMDVSSTESILVAEAARRRADALYAQIAEEAAEQVKDGSVLREALKGRYDAYVNDTDRMTKADQLSHAIREENAAFDRAVAGIPKGTKDYIAAAEAHDKALKNLREKHKDKTESAKDLMAGLGLKDIENALARETAAVEAAMRDVEMAYSRGDMGVNAYYDRRVALVERSASAQESATTREIELLRSLDAKGKEGTQIREQIAAAETKLAIARAKNSSEVAALRAEEEALFRGPSLDNIKYVTDTEIALREQNRALAEQIEYFDLTESQIARLKVARIEETMAQQQALLATKEASGAGREELDVIEQRIAALYNLRDATEASGRLNSRHEEQQRTKERVEAQVQSWTQGIDKIHGLWIEGFSASLDRNEDALDAFFKSSGRALQNTLATAIYEATFKPVVIRFVAQLAGLVGGDSLQSGILKQAGLDGQSVGNLASLVNNAGKVWNGVSSALGFGTAAAATTGVGSAAAGLGLAGWGTLGSGAAAMTGAGLGTASAAAGLGLTGSALGTGMGAATGAGLGLSAGGATLGGVAGTSAAATGAAAGAGAGIMGTIGAAAPYVALAVAAFSLLSGSFKGETRSGAQYGLALDGELYNPRRGTTVSSANGVQFLEGPSGGGASPVIQASIQATTDAINDLFKTVGADVSLTSFWAGYEGSEKGRGGVGAGGRLSTGAAFGETGQGDNYRGTLYDGSRPTSLTAEQAMSMMPAQLAQASLQAMQAVAHLLPEAIARSLRGVDLSSMADDQLIALDGQIRALVTQAEQLRVALVQLPFVPATAQTFDFALALAEAAGGAQNAASLLTGYYANYYTEAERAAWLTEDLTRRFSELGFALPTTRAEFRGLVEANLALGDAGARTVAGLLSMEAALSSLLPAFEAVVDVVEDVVDPLAALNEAMDAQMDTVQRLAQEAARLEQLRSTAGGVVDQIDRALGRTGRYGVARETELWARLATASYEQQVELAGELTDIVLERYTSEIEAAERMRDLGRSLAGYLESLRTGDLSPLTLGQRTAEAERQLMATIARAEAGDETAMGQVQSQLEASLRLWREYGASGADYQAAYERLTGAAGDLAERAQSDAERQLGMSQESLDQLEQLHGVASRAYAAIDRQYQATLQASRNEMAVLTAMASDTGRLHDVAGLLQGLPAGIAAALQPVLSGAMGNIVSGWYAGAGYGAGDQAGRDYWTGQLGSKPTTDVQKDFLTSLVKDWYKDTLGWAQPDAGGLAYWVAEAQRIGAQAARRDFLIAAGINGSHRDGLWSVPFDGYRAELHVGETVLPEPEARRYRALEAMPDWSQYGRQDNAALIAELREVRKELAQLRAEQARQAAQQIGATVQSGQQSAEAIVQGVGGAIQQRQRDDTNSRQAQRAGIYTTA